MSGLLAAVAIVGGSALLVVEYGGMGAAAVAVLAVAAVLALPRGR